MNKSRNYSNKKVKKFRKTKRRGGTGSGSLLSSMTAMKNMIPNPLASAFPKKNSNKPLANKPNASKPNASKPNASNP